MRDYAVISGETLTIRRTNPRTFLFIYFMIIFGFVFAAMMFLVPHDRFPFLMIVPVFFAFFLGGRIWGLLTTITIGPEGVEFKSPLKQRTHAWNKIAVAGMYIKSRNRNQRIGQERFQEKFVFRLKYVWFSELPGGEPSVWTFPGEDYCDFEFRQDAWELFDKYIRARSAPNKLPGFNALQMGDTEEKFLA